MSPPPHHRPVLQSTWPHHRAEQRQQKRGSRAAFFPLRYRTQHQSVSLQPAQTQPLASCYASRRALAPRLGTRGQRGTRPRAELGEAPLHGSQEFKGLPRSQANLTVLRFSLSGRASSQLPKQSFKQDLLGWRLSAEQLSAGEFCQTPRDPFICSDYLSQFPPGFSLSLWCAEVLCAGPCTRHRGFRTVGLPRSCPLREYGPSAARNSV